MGKTRSAGNRGEAAVEREAGEYCCTCVRKAGVSV